MSEEFPEFIYDTDDWPDDVDATELFDSPNQSGFFIERLDPTSALNIIRNRPVDETLYRKVTLSVPIDWKFDIGELISIDDSIYRVLAVLQEDIHLFEAKKRVTLRIEPYEGIKEESRLVLNNPDPNIPRCGECNEPLTGLVILPTKLDDEGRVDEVKWVASHHGVEITLEGLHYTLWPGANPLPKHFSHLYVRFEERDIVCIPPPHDRPACTDFRY
jgi:hypothetical protein